MEPENERNIEQDIEMLMAEQDEFLRAAGVIYLRNNLRNLARVNSVLRRDRSQNNDSIDLMRERLYYVIERVLMNNQLSKRHRIWLYQQLGNVHGPNHAEAEYFTGLLNDIPDDKPKKKEKKDAT